MFWNKESEKIGKKVSKIKESEKSEEKNPIIKHKRPEKVDDSQSDLRKIKGSEGL